MKKTNVEAELKYTIDTGDLDSLIAKPEISRFLTQMGQHKSYAMRSVYYDTYDQKLREHKIVLRRRRANTRYFITMKAPITAHDGVFLRKEWEYELSGEDCLLDPRDGLDKAWFLRRLRENGKPADDDAGLIHVLDKIDGVPLREVCGSDFMRMAYRLSYRGSLFELALDQGYLFAQDRNAPFEEIELELLEGSLEDIQELNDIWLAKLPILPNTLTKYERAIALFDER